MLTRRRGFTMVEMLFVLVIGALIMTFATRGYSQVANERAVDNARDAVISTSLQARSEAMRSGQLVYMDVDPAAGTVLIREADGDVLHTADMSEYGVTMVGSTESVCYAARGYALPGCTTLDGDLDLEFVRAGDTAAVVILPLGQVQRSQ